MWIFFTQWAPAYGHLHLLFVRESEYFIEFLCNCWFFLIQIIILTFRKIKRFQWLPFLWARLICVPAPSILNTRSIDVEDRSLQNACSFVRAWPTEDYSYDFTCDWSELTWPTLLDITNHFFTITAEIHARSLVKFYGQYADRHMNLKFVRRISERERAIWPFVIIKNRLMSVFNASVLLLMMNFVLTLPK